MALLLMDGFEHTGSYGARKWVASSSVSTTQAHTGSYSSTSAFAVLPNISGSTCIVGAWVYGNGFRIRVMDGYSDLNSTTQCSVCVQADGRVTFNNGNAGTILGSSVAGLATANVWHFVEFKVVIHASAGTVTVNFNGNAIITETGKNTAYVGGTEWTGIILQAGSYYDDVWICDGSGSYNNDFLGPCRVETLLPSTGNGSNTDFTCSTSTDHGEMVNDATAPNDNTDYVYSSTLNHVDTWNYPSMTYSGTIKAVQLCLGVSKDETGARAIAAVARPASTNRVHATNRYLGVGYEYHRVVYEVNPEDSAAWEVADVNGAEFGVKVTV